MPPPTGPASALREVRRVFGGLRPFGRQGPVCTQSHSPSLSSSYLLVFSSSPSSNFASLALSLSCLVPMPARLSPSMALGWRIASHIGKVLYKKEKLKISKYIPQAFLPPLELKTATSVARRPRAGRPPVPVRAHCACATLPGRWQGQSPHSGLIVIVDQRDQSRPAAWATIGAPSPRGRSSIISPVACSCSRCAVSCSCRRVGVLFLCGNYC